MRLKHSIPCIVLALTASCAVPSTPKRVSRSSIKTPNPKENTQNNSSVKNENSQKVQRVGKEIFVRQNIGDISKNDNTISYSAVVKSNLPGYNVSTQYLPSIAQNFRQKFIILHYTAIDDDTSLLALTQRNVSAHYLINAKEDNDIYLLVDENKRAYHAGISSWREDNNLNDNSIGIEIVNLGNKNGGQDMSAFQPFPEYQIKKVAALVKDLATRYNIKPQNIIGHSDIAPTRKPDPGPMFPWKRLYNEYGIGMWYNESDKNAELMRISSTENFTEPLSPSLILQFQKKLKDFGYDVLPSGSWDEVTKKTTLAFQYHFRPQKSDGALDAETFAILTSLIKKYPK